MTPELREACVRAVHVVTPEGEILRAGRASLDVLERLGYRRLVALSRRRPLIWVVEIGYAFVARNRSWIGKLF